MANLSSMLARANHVDGDDSTVPLPKAASKIRQGQCTHMTVTRIYAGDFRCAMCLQTGSMGWLYRCTQDRELLIEDDLDRDVMKPFDQLAAIFPVSSSPKKRSPAACTSSNLAFLNEISEEAFKGYTPVQASTILKQRAKLLAVVKEREQSFTMPATEGLHLTTSSNNRYLPLSVFSTPPEMFGSPPKSKKSWLPTRTQECQFKCCHACRPNLHERSYLSLDAIADGEIPATAITGFGFHYQKERPIALVKHVQSLGLRPNTTSRMKSRYPTVSSLSQPPASRKRKDTVELATSSSTFNNEENADTTFGQLSNAYGSSAMTRSLNIESVRSLPGGGSSFGATTRKAFEEMILPCHSGAKSETSNRSGISKDPPRKIVRPPWTPPNSPQAGNEELTTEGTASEIEVLGSNRRSNQSLNTDRHLRSCFNLDEFHEDGDVGLFLPLGDALLSRACATMLPAETTEEQLIGGLPSAETDITPAHRSSYGDETLILEPGNPPEEDPPIRVPLM